MNCYTPCYLLCPLLCPVCARERRARGRRSLPLVALGWLQRLADLGAGLLQQLAHARLADLVLASQILE